MARLMWWSLVASAAYAAGKRQGFLEGALDMADRLVRADMVHRGDRGAS
jgi:hypothetical protein